MTKILVVEDDDNIRDEVVDWLRFEGYEASGAVNGRVGLDALRREPPDLIVSDIAMPEMNGYDLLLCVRLEENLSQTPFIFLTAAADHEAMRKGMNLGADDYITKPFTNIELIHTIRVRLEKRALHEQQQQAQIDTLIAALNEEREQRLLKSRLTAMISHDFRNPLAAILSSCDIIKNYEDRMSPERKHQYLDRIDGSVRLLMQMLDDLLMVAQMESGHLELVPESIELVGFVDAIVDEFRLIDQGAHHITYDSMLECAVTVDPKFLRQLIVNLISNALKYSAHGTTIKVGLNKADAEIELVIEDQGMGIPSADLPRLFEPFYRADNAKGYRGLGLGMSIVKQAVELHGGTIAVDSVIGRGTRFTVLLPHMCRESNSMRV